MFRVLELRVLLLADRRLHFVKRLLNEHTVLNVQDTICVALDVWVVSHHHAGGRCVLTLTLRTDTVDVQYQVHDRD